MKKLAMAALLTAFSTPALATSLSWGGEVDAGYNVDTEVMDVTLTPELNYGLSEMTVLSLSSDLTVWNSDTEVNIGDYLDDLPTLEFGVDHDLGNGTALYGEMSYDLEAEERGDITVGVTFNF